MKLSRYINLKNLLLVWLIVTILAGSFGFKRIGVDIQHPILFNMMSSYLALLLALFYFSLIAVSTNFRNTPSSDRNWKVAMIIFFCYLICTSFWSPSFKDSIALFPGFFIIIISVMVASYIFRSDFTERLKFLAAIMVVVGIAYFLAGVLNYGHGKVRMAAFGGGPNVFVRVVGMAALSMFFFWVLKKKNIWLVMMLPLIGAIILSGSRGGAIAFIVSICVYVFMVLQVSFSRLAIGLLLVLVTGYTIIKFTKVGVIITEFFVNRFYELSILDRYTSGRETLYREGIELFSNHPIFGSGLSGFAHYTGTRHAYPHNLLIEIACIGGVVALLMFIILGLLIIRRFGLKCSPYHIYALINGIFIFCASMFSGAFYDSRFMWFFFTIYMINNEQTK